MFRVKTFSLCVLAVISCVQIVFSEALIIDHEDATLDTITETQVLNAKSRLHIAYGHTSHGSQLVTGMAGLVTFKGSLYSYAAKGVDDVLDLRDTPFSGANDLGNPNRTAWATATRNYLDQNPDINTIIWSWCGQAGTANESDIETYLSLMNALEEDYPSVYFVYMTGHLDGSGVDGNLNQRNEQIRAFCRENGKILYDFADIESYDPDGNYYLDKMANDNCDYDSDGNGSRDANWAEEWQDAHPGEWYSCSAAHSKALNGNRKAYAAWNLWAGIAELLNPLDVSDAELVPLPVRLGENFPNPFNGATTIPVMLSAESEISLDVYSISGQHVATVASGRFSAGQKHFIWDGTDKNGVSASSGLYFYRLSSNGMNVLNRKMLYMK